MPVTMPKAAAFAGELPEDLQWLAEHQGAPYTPESCRLTLRSLAPAIDKHERMLAEARHELGTALIDLLTHGAVHTLGCATVAEFFEKHCGLCADDAYEYIRFAKGVTAEQAATYRFSRCREGIKLVRQLGRRDLADLARTPIEVPLEDGTSETLAFTPKTPVSKLKWALARLREASRPSAPRPGRDVARRLREFEAVIEECAGRYPVLADAGLRATLYAGEVRVQHRPLTSQDQFVAAEALYAKLKRLR